MSVSTTDQCNVDQPDRLRAAVQMILTSDDVELPMLPEVAAQVLEMTSDIDCDPRDLVELIRRDQSMAGHLMRVANSARYAATQTLTSVQQAIARLGLICIREVVVLIACETRIFDVDEFEPQVRRSFRRSLAVAAFAQELARVRRQNVEEAFMVGLLHDVGRPVLLQSLSDIRKQESLADADKLLLRLAEEHRVPLAARLIDLWQLPPRLSKAVGHQLNPAEAECCFDLAGVLNLAIDIARCTLETDEILDEETFTHPMIEPLNLYRDQIGEVFCKTQSILEWVDSTS
jgi:HD-like signal output (HDOD) protein